MPSQTFRPISLAKSVRESCCGPERNRCKSCMPARPNFRSGSSIKCALTATRIGRPFRDILRGETPMKPTIAPLPSSHTSEGRLSSHQGLRKKISSKASPNLCREGSACRAAPDMLTFRQRAATRGMSFLVKLRVKFIAIVFTSGDCFYLAMKRYKTGDTVEGAEIVQLQIVNRNARAESLFKAQ